MTKVELAKAVAMSSDLTLRQVKVLVQTVLDSIVEALRSGEKVELRGFGSFRLKERNGRLGRNPKTGESVQVPAKRIARFRVGKELRELINS